MDQDSLARPRLLETLASPFLRSLGVPRLREMYREVAGIRDPERYFSTALRALGIEFDLPDEHASRIPREGPVVVIANHPRGGADGIALAALLFQRRKDVLLAVTTALSGIEELRPWCCFLDPGDSPSARAVNAASLRTAYKHLRAGGLLMMFPAGAVSHFHWRSMEITDPAWSPAAADLARRTRATVVNAYFSGRNSFLFQAAGVVHPALRTALLPRELLRSRGCKFSARVGHPVPPEKLEGFRDAQDATAYLRLRTYVLARRVPGAAHSSVRTAAAPRGASIAGAVPAAELKQEVEALAPDRTLLQSGDWRVCCAPAAELPLALREIGRLREITFRACGEGTGRGLDLDRFDYDYLHLFLWNERTHEIGGAYRVGRSDEILLKRGVAGLYVHTLFEFRESLLQSWGPSLELGRSFVVQKYQRSPIALSLLWKGIGRVVAGRPAYRKLYGTVSISADYDELSRQLMQRFLRENAYAPGLGRAVKARRRPVPARLSEFDAAARLVAGRDLEAVSALVSEVEEDRKGVPILLRQYLRLGGRVLGFNVDPEFGNVLDALVVVDLDRTETRVLEHYMGRDGLARFRDAGAKPQAPHAS